MYLDHFGLYTAPFSLVPHLRFLYLSTAFEETMAHLLYGLEGGEDIILITGEIGSGKTLALNNLAKNVKGQYRVAVVNNTQVQFNELLKLALAELDVTVPSGADRADLLNVLKQTLDALSVEGKRLLLIIDEAQNLDVATLEGVRLLTNLGPDEVQRVQLILAGQPGLRKKIDLPELAQVRQRIRVHYHLESLTASETAEYITHRLKVAGREKLTFTPEAVAEIHSRSCGVPRLVNILADKALLAGYVDGVQLIKPEHVPEEELALSPIEELQGAERAAESSEMVVPSWQRVEEKAAKFDETSEDAIDVLDDDSEPWGRGGASSGWRRLLVAAVVVIAAVVVAFGLWRTRSNDSDVGSDLVASELEIPEVETLATAAPDSLVEAVAGGDTAMVALSALQTDPEALVEDAPLDTLVVDGEPAAMEPDLPSLVEDNEFAAEELDYVLELEGPCVHVASFLEHDRAKTMQARLAQISQRTEVLQVMINGTIWYRLYSGPWDSVEQAQRYQVDIRDAGMSDWALLVVLKKP